MPGQDYAAPTPCVYGLAMHARRSRQSVKSRRLLESEASEAGEKGIVDAKLRNPLKKCELSGMAITAAIHAGGTLHEIGGALTKLLAAARERTLPRVHTVIVAGGQDLNNIGLVPDPQNAQLFKDPHADFHVIKATTLEEAVRLLEIEADTRWSSIDCALPPHQPDFVERQRLTAAVQQFIATQESGYLVLVGGVGKGKSTWLAEFLYDEQARGKAPVYHLVDYHPSASGGLHNIAACLYDRLRRKYVFLEPPEWQGFSPAIKFERLLKHLSETELRAGQTEVLYIDAADQTDASRQQPLLPGTLRTLPPGVLCVITSRTRLDWLRTEQAVTVWDLDQYVDDRADIRAYLHHRGPRLSPPLSEAFTEEILTQADPPVFFTVASCLRRLESEGALASDEHALRENPALWVVPAEERIRTEALRVLAEAEAQGIPETKVWQTLGLLAVAQEALSEAQLEALELWETGTTDRILWLAANFFRPRPLLR